MPNRPPIKTAHQHATKVLCQEYNERWQELVNEYLAKNGWAQQEVTTKKWARTEVAETE